MIIDVQINKSISVNINIYDIITREKEVLMSENKKISFKEAKKMPWYKVLAYALTECAGNLVFCTVTTYINYYYTNVFGLAAGATGTIMLVVRIFDAFDAPI